MTTIIHRGFWKNKKQFYLCNQAVKSTQHKITMMWGEVTCKNCIKNKTSGC